MTGSADTKTYKVAKRRQSEIALIALSLWVLVVGCLVRRIPGPTVAFIGIGAVLCTLAAIYHLTDQIKISQSRIVRRSLLTRTRSMEVAQIDHIERFTSSISLVVGKSGQTIRVESYRVDRPDELDYTLTSFASSHRLPMRHSDVYRDLKSQGRRRTS